MDCQNSSEYDQIPITKELIDFKGDLSCLKAKHKFEELECEKPFGNCKFYEERVYNSTAVNKTVLMVSWDIFQKKISFSFFHFSRKQIMVIIKL